MSENFDTDTRGGDGIRAIGLKVGSYSAVAVAVHSDGSRDRIVRRSALDLTPGRPPRLAAVGESTDGLTAVSSLAERNNTYPMDHRHFVTALTCLVAELTPDTPPSVAVAHPSTWSNETIREIGRLAAQRGLIDIAFISEPSATVSWIEQSEDLPHDQALLVVDLGASTLDVSAIRIGADGRCRSAGRPLHMAYFGGDALDRALADHLLVASGTRFGDDDALLRACARARETLSLRSSVQIEVPFGEPVEMSRQELNDILRPTLESVVEQARLAMRSAELGDGDIGRVVLIGGCASTPLLVEMISMDVRAMTTIEQDPVATSAGGAALIAATRADRSDLPPARVRRDRRARMAAGSATAGSAAAGPAAAGPAAAEPATGLPAAGGSAAGVAAAAESAAGVAAGGVAAAGGSAAGVAAAAGSAESRGESDSPAAAPVETGGSAREAVEAVEAVQAAEAVERPEPPRPAEVAEAPSAASPVIEPPRVIDEPISNVPTVDDASAIDEPSPGRDEPAADRPAALVGEVPAGDRTTDGTNPEEAVADSPSPLEPVTSDARPIEPIASNPRPAEPIAGNPGPAEPVTSEARPIEPIASNPRPIGPVTDAEAPITAPDTSSAASGGSTEPAAFGETTAAAATRVETPTVVRTPAAVDNPAAISTPATNTPAPAATTAAAATPTAAATTAAAATPTAAATPAAAATESRRGRTAEEPVAARSAGVTDAEDAAAEPADRPADVPEPRPAISPIDFGPTSEPIRFYPVSGSHPVTAGDAPGAGATLSGEPAAAPAATRETPATRDAPETTAAGETTTTEDAIAAPARPGAEASPAEPEPATERHLLPITGGSTEAIGYAAAIREELAEVDAAASPSAAPGTRPAGGSTTGARSTTDARPTAGARPTTGARSTAGAGATADTGTSDDKATPAAYSAVSFDEIFPLDRPSRWSTDRTDPSADADATADRSADGDRAADNSAAAPAAAPKGAPKGAKRERGRSRAGVWVLAGAASLAACGLVIGWLLGTRSTGPSDATVLEAGQTATTVITTVITPEPLPAPPETPAPDPDPPVEAVANQVPAPAPQATQQVAPAPQVQQAAPTTEFTRRPEVGKPPPQAEVAPVEIMPDDTARRNQSDSGGGSRRPPSLMDVIFG